MEPKKRIDTRHGSGQMRIEHRRDEHLKIGKYRVVCGDAGTRGASTTEFEKRVASDSKFGDEIPAPPAVPALLEHECYECSKK